LEKEALKNSIRKGGLKKQHWKSKLKKTALEKET